MDYKYYWDSGRHYCAVLKYLAGCNLASLLEEYPEVRWKLVRLPGVPCLVSLHEAGNLIALVCMASSHVCMDALEPIVQQRCGDAHINVESTRTLNDLEHRRERLVSKLRGLYAFLIPRSVMEFPPFVSVGFLNRIFTGRRGGSVSEYIKQVQTLQSLVPGGALGLDYDELCIGASDMGLWLTFYRKKLLTTAGTLFFEPPKPLLRYPESEGTCVLVDGENISVDVLDLALCYDLECEGTECLPVMVFDSDISSLEYALVKERHPEVELKKVGREGSLKSQVDFAIRDEFSKQYYCNGCRKFVIVSSDSDYVNLVTQYPDAEIYYVLQRSSTARAWREKLDSEGIPHRFLDESMHQWNIRTLRIEVAVNEAKKMKDIRFEDPVEWSEFVKTLPSFGVFVFDQARKKLLSGGKENG